MQRKRLIKLLTGVAVAISVGLIYAAFTVATNIGIPCVFRLITRLLCPGCGISRMLLALLRLDFKAAFGYHPVMLCLLLPLAICFSAMAVDYVKKGETVLSLWQKIILVLSCTVLIAFCIVRNIMLII